VESESEKVTPGTSDAYASCFPTVLEDGLFLSCVELRIIFEVQLGRKWLSMLSLMSMEHGLLLDTDLETIITEYPVRKNLES